MNIDNFIIVLLERILHYPAAPGKLIVIYKTDLAKSSQIGDITSYICEDVKRALAYYRYLLIPELCTSEYFVVLDIHIGYIDHLDFVSRVKYSFDHENGEVVSEELDSFPVDLDFSLTPEELDALVYDLRPKYIADDIVRIKGKRGFWKISYVFNPWDQHPQYAPVYSSLRIQNPEELYFYALKAINNNQKPITVLEKDIELDKQG